MEKIFQKVYKSEKINQIMREEIENWWKQSEKDLKAAKNSLNSGDYEWACFQTQQAVEKALKAVYIKKYKRLLKIHDLVLLARKINAPKEIIVLCSKINPSYTDTRYPDLSKSYTEEDAKEILNFSEEILEWIKNNL